MRAIVTRYAGAFGFVPRNQVRFKNAFKMPSPEIPAAPPPPPAPEAPPPMPMADQNSPAMIEATRKATQAATSGGRQSTILTTAATRAKGTVAGSYASNKLGAK